MPNTPPCYNCLHDAQRGNVSPAAEPQPIDSTEHAIKAYFNLRIASAGVGQHVYRGDQKFAWTHHCTSHAALVVRISKVRASN